MGRYICSKKNREIVFRRDNYTCRICGWNQNNSINYNKNCFFKELFINSKGKLVTLDIDHIIPYSISRDSSLNNLQTLCNICNSKKSNKRI